MNALFLLPILFGMSSYLYYRKRKKIHRKSDNILGMSMLLFVFAFSVLAIIFYYHPDFKGSVHEGSGKTYIDAAIYFFLLYILWLSPFLKGDYTDYTKVICSPIVKGLVTIIAVSSLIEAVLLLPNALSGYNTMVLGDIAGVREHDIGNIGSGITSIPVLIYSFFGTILPLAFFYYLSAGIKRGELVLIAIATFLTPILNTLSTGSREFFVFPLIETGIAYLIFYRFLSKRVKKGVNFTFLILGGLIFVSSVLMSLIRFTNSASIDPSFWIAKYLGEGFVNFNTLLYPNLGEPCYGEFHFGYFRDLIGLSYVPDSMRASYWSPRMQFPHNLFYSFLGSIVIDWGKTGAFIISAFFVGLTHLFTRIKGKTILFSQLIILHFVACICTKGVFYFTYLSYFGGRTILYVILLCLLLRFVGRT